MKDADWQLLEAELGKWQTPARLWLRDDDAFEPTAALDKLFDLVARFEIALLLAVIPKPAKAALAERVHKKHGVLVAQHGFSHRNHAPAGQKKCEIGLHRDRQIVLGELSAGREKLLNLFGAQFIDMLVPPWNRMDGELAALLPDLGFKTISAFSDSDHAARVAGLGQLNTHIDLIDWKGTRGGKSENVLIGEVTEALETARLAGGAPVGLLSHHLDSDDAAWQFLEGFFEFVAGRNDIGWCSPVQLTGQ